MIRFNKPFTSGNELKYIQEAIYESKLSGDGKFTFKCQNFFKEKYGFNNNYFTTSCTDALEMAAILIDIKSGDEVIIPSFTFVSTANAFVLRGAKIVFADSCIQHPNIDHEKIEQLITPRTKAIVIVHYAGVACEMETIMKIAEKHNLYLIEDAAQAIDSYYKGKALGGFGHLSAFSFHETKNVTSGEGGLLVVNDSQFVKRAEIIREKGTNRSSFFRGEVNKYGWVDIGSSFLQSDLNAAFLLGQLESLEMIQKRRIEIWDYYYSHLKSLEEKGYIKLPTLPAYATNNGHMFYFTTNTASDFTGVLEFLNKNGIKATFHYQPLHLSSFFLSETAKSDLENAVRFSETLIRLPLFFELKESELSFICNSLIQFFS